MKLPTYEQGLKYFEEYVVPKNIKNHCIKVHKVARFLAKELAKKDPSLNIELVSMGALLHDLFKVAALKELKPTKYHPYEASEQELSMHKKLRAKYPAHYEGDVAYEVFKDEFPELAVLLKQCSDPKNFNKTPEQLLVHYADCRVLATNIVSTKERLAYLHEVYPGHQGAFDKEYEYMFAYEENLFKQLSFTPQELEEKMNHGE